MNKIERVTAVMEGRRPDRPPVSFWYHFGSDKIAGPAAVEAHVRHVETYDLDFLKIMDDNRYPRFALPAGFVESPSDLDRLSVLAGDEDSFGQQLELIAALANRFGGQLLKATTLFSSWSTLRQMTVPDSGQHHAPQLTRTVNERDAKMTRLLREAPRALERALGVIAESLANFAGQCIAAGADGVFLSVADEIVDSPENGAGTYESLVCPGDLQILAGAREASLNLLHVCGKALDFDRFASYPVHVVNWADRTAGPPIAAVAHSLRPAICAGVDNLRTLVTGSPDDCAREVADAIEQAGDRPILIAPGCTFDPLAVPSENLHALRAAVDRA
jgi:uroporphyrinogen decarboxylase